MYLSPSVILTMFVILLGCRFHLSYPASLRFATLAWIVTAFTVAHSITLLASAFGHAPGGLWFPPLIETLIAVSILYMALENIVGSNPRRRWMIAFAVWLVRAALRQNAQRHRNQARLEP
jgi:hypothetical protein